VLEQRYHIVKGLCRMLQTSATRQPGLLHWLSQCLTLICYSAHGRQELIDTAREILEVFDDRQKPYSAVEMAYIAQGSPEPTSGHASTVQLAQAALRAVKLARQGMADTVECLLGWMAVLHEEATEVQRLMTTPTDLLQVLVLPCAFTPTCLASHIIRIAAPFPAHVFLPPASHHRSLLDLVGISVQ
jgi:hypothetical protein